MGARGPLRGSAIVPRRSAPDPLYGTAPIVMTRTVTEFQDRSLVEVDGVAISGFVVPEVLCPACGAAAIYDDVFDAQFCPQCDNWLEPKCSDPSCQNCIARPERPLGRV